MASCAGRFGSEFVENRRSGLQAALMKIVAHPMLVGDPDLRLFLESDTFSVDVSPRVHVDGIERQFTIPTSRADQATQD